jgi:hypothetical protein
MKNIATALVKAQSEMSNPKKGNTNPFFKSKYADLNAVREAVIPILNDNGISVLQPLIHKDGKNFVNTILLHESGELMESYTEIIYNKVNDAQAQGSGITYARRYGLQSFVCVGADDDDGNIASQPPQSKEVKIDIPRLETRLTACKTVEELGKVYKSFSEAEQNAVKAFTQALKNSLTLTPTK